MDVLRGFLDRLRAAVAAKAQDVPEPRVRTPGVPSGTSLLGLVRHDLTRPVARPGRGAPSMRSGTSSAN